MLSLPFSSITVSRTIKIMIRNEVFIQYKVISVFQFIIKEKC